MRPASFFSLIPRNPDLKPDCRPTCVRHLAFTLLDAAAAGILANAPLMALKGMESAEWQLAIQLPISSLGMFFVLWLGGWMAGRHPMPFVLWPGMAYALCSVAMAFSSQPLVFLILGGISTLFETASRPAVTAIIRANYPATHRGAVTGMIRQWHLITLLTAGSLSAWAMDLAGSSQSLMIRSQMILAGVLSACAFLIFRTVRVREDQPFAGDARVRIRSDVMQPLADAWRVLRRDRRFRLYLVIGFLFAFGGLLYVAYVPVLFSRRLHFGYLASSLFANTLPSLVSILFTGMIGRWIDRVNTWKAWAAIRLGWGLDPILLAAASLLAGVHPLAPLAASCAGRVSRGLVMGGSWVLWWQVGVSHFASPGGDTTRYMGLVLFVNGLARLLAPMAGAWMLTRLSLDGVFLLGGLLVLLSAGLSWIQFLKERGDQRFKTIQRFEEECMARG